MKKLRILIVVGVIAALAVILAACGAPALPRPENLSVNEQTLELAWKEVDGAKGYIVSISGDERTTRRNTYSLAVLASGTYNIKVKARGDGDNNDDSAWSSEIMFVKANESGLSYKLINSNTEYEVSGMGTANGDVVVDDVFRGKPVTSIGNSAFYNSGKLTSITIGNNVKSIGELAFYNCSYLEQVTIPNTVTEIGKYAFQGCRALQSIVIPDSVTKINNNTFSNCRALETVDFGSGVTEIGDYAFNSCVKLKNLVFPDNVKTIGQFAFSDCIEKDGDNAVVGGIESIDLGSVVTLGTNAFYKCAALKTIDFGTALGSIGEYSFADCDSLNNIVIPDNVKAIEAYAFYGCDALDTVKIGTGVAEIGDSAFNATKLWMDVSGTQSTTNPDTYGLVYVDNWLVGNKDRERARLKIDDGTVGIGYGALISLTKVSEVRFPDSLKYIGEYAFYNCTNLPNMPLNKVEIIGSNAFRGCSNMTSVGFGEEIRSIGSYAFANCTHLTNPTTKFPDTLESIGVYAFYGTAFWNSASGVVYASNWVVGYKASSDSIISINNGTIGIGDYAFNKATNIMAISIPDSVKTIGESAFSGCAALTGVTLPSGLKDLNPFVFYGCYSLTTVVLNDGLQTIGRSAFYNCYSLQEIVIPDSVKLIDSYAFYNCTLEFFGYLLGGLSKVTLGSGLETIGSRAFAKNVFLEEIVIPDSVTSIGAYAFNNTGIRSLTIGAGLESIGEYAFAKNVYLEEVVIPDTVKTIEANAFRNCTGLKSLTIGAGVESIGQYAFSGCSSLRSIAIPENVKTIDNYAFYKCSAVESVNIGSYVESVGRHALYGNKLMTVYFEGDSIPTDWNQYWNSSYRPVIFGCEFTADKTELVSITLGEIINPDAINGISAPVKPDYVGAGWSTSVGGDVEIEIGELTQSESGKKLYPVWEEYVEPEPEPELPEQPETQE